MRARLAFWVAALAVCATPLRAQDSLPNGFPADGLRVPRTDLIAGGPLRDGIHAVDAPRFATLRESRAWVRDSQAVVGLLFEGEARAYPVHLLEFHQVVNDVVNGRAIAITYDPLIDVARAYHAPSRKDQDAPARYGVSGLIYRCNFLLYDRRDESLWTQWDGVAVTGAHVGEALEAIPVRVENLGVWRRRHPKTRVLVEPEPRRIDYRHSHFATYWVSGKIPFPVDHVDSRIHPKELVLGARVGDTARAYLATVVQRRGGRIVDELEGHRIRIEYSRGTGTFSFEAPAAVDLTSAYWFAWKNFEPETELWNVQMDQTDETPMGRESSPAH